MLYSLSYSLFIIISIQEISYHVTLTWHALFGTVPHFNSEKQILVPTSKHISKHFYFKNHQSLQALVVLCISRVLVFCARSAIIDRHGALEMFNIIQFLLPTPLQLAYICVILDQTIQH